MLERRILTAEVVYNGLGTPRADGAVVVQHTGAEEQIVFIGDLATARRNFPDALEERVGFAISPPPVNAHTHLDLSTMTFTPGDYEAFIAEVIATSQAGRRGSDAAEKGRVELRRYGTTTVGDIVTRAEVMHFLLSSDLHGVAYWEVLGPDPADAERLFDETVDKLRAFKAQERPGGMRVGLSPHSPHTVSAPLLQKLARLAQQNKLPLQIHVAESALELAFHRDGSAFHSLQTLADWQPSGLTPVGYLEKLGVLDAAPTLVHMIHVTEDDVRAVQKAGCVVVHCPRSNVALNCGRFPWELYAKHGVTVAFGTDGRGSSPTLSIEDEVRAARELHGDKANPLALVWSAVKGGYRALGMQPPKILRGDAFSRFHVWRERA
ncbi:amidohydrolase family protein [soil metagenome]